MFTRVVSVLWLMQAASSAVAITYDPDCNFFQKAEPSQTYYIYSPGYPQNYVGSHRCRWVAESPPNTILQLYCEDVQVPANSNQNCDIDVILVSPSGNDDYNDAHKYCGRGKFSINSNSNKITIGFFSRQNTPGGRFLCSLSVVEPTPSCDCGWRNMNRIVGGVDTGVNEFPMMAGLVNFEQSSVFCGSSIISKNYVVTAAHCVDNAQVRNVGVLVGDWDLSTGMDTPKAKLYNVSQFVVHRDYNKTTFANDIALVRTKTSIIFSLEVGPACLPILYQTTNFQGTYVTELGWGTLGFGEAPSDILQKVDVRWISLEVCQQTYSTVQNRQFCTYADNKDACQGDSGGPAVWQKDRDSRLQLLGIISSGNACAIRNRPGVNTRVAAYLDWIRVNAQGESFCARN